MHCRSSSVPNGLDGKFSVKYCASAALLDGSVGIETFTDTGRFSPDMEETLRNIHVKPGGQGSAMVKATAQCRGFRGSAANPMKREERMDKILDCVRRVLSEQDTVRLLTLPGNVADISAIMEILGQEPPEGRECLEVESPNPAMALAPHA